MSKVPDLTVAFISFDVNPRALTLADHLSASVDSTDVIFNIHKFHKVKEQLYPIWWPILRKRQPPYHLHRHHRSSKKILNYKRYSNLRIWCMLFRPRVHLLSPPLLDRLLPIPGRWWTLEDRLDSAYSDVSAPLLLSQFFKPFIKLW